MLHVLGSEARRLFPRLRIGQPAPRRGPAHGPVCGPAERCAERRGEQGKQDLPAPVGCEVVTGRVSCSVPRLFVRRSAGSMAR